jgi:hypothetical protein
MTGYQKMEDVVEAHGNDLVHRIERDGATYVVVEPSNTENRAPSFYHESCPCPPLAKRIMSRTSIILANPRLQTGVGALLTEDVAGEITMLDLATVMN